VLRELGRRGYVVEPPSAESQSLTICRHDERPDLVVRHDGRIELLSEGSDIRESLQVGFSEKRLHRGRALLFLALLGIATFLGLLVFAMIVG
jgi:hypothetical protein